MALEKHSRWLKISDLKTQQKFRETHSLFTQVHYEDNKGFCWDCVLKEMNDLGMPQHPIIISNFLVEKDCEIMLTFEGIMNRWVLCPVCKKPKTKEELGEKDTEEIVETHNIKTRFKLFKGRRYQIEIHVGGMRVSHIVEEPQGYQTDKEKD